MMGVSESKCEVGGGGGGGGGVDGRAFLVIVLGYAQCIKGVAKF